MIEWANERVAAETHLVDEWWHVPIENECEWKPHEIFIKKERKVLMPSKGWQVRWIIERIIDYFYRHRLRDRGKKRIGELNAADDDLHSQKFIDDDSRCPCCLSSYSRKDIFISLLIMEIESTGREYTYFSLSLSVSRFSLPTSSLSHFSTITTLVADKRNCHDRYINTCLEFEFSFSCYTNENTHSPVSYRPCPAIRHRHTHISNRGHY